MCSPTDKKSKKRSKKEKEKALKEAAGGAAHGPTGGAPDSKTIIACHARVWGKHLGEIRANRGCMVGVRSGHRRAEKPNKRGGKRVKGPSPHEGPGEWLNDDARGAQVEKFERCEAGVSSAR